MATRNADGDMEEDGMGWGGLIDSPHEEQYTQRPLDAALADAKAEGERKAAEAYRDGWAKGVANVATWLRRLHGEMPGKDAGVMRVTLSLVARKLESGEWLK